LSKSVLIPIHRDGWRFVAVFAAASVGAAFLYEPLGWLGAGVTAWCAYFFRDPSRVTPVEAGLVISPADGIVQAVRPRTPPRELEMGGKPLPCVSIFMNIFDVHVNRVPVDGTVTKIAYRPGKFFNASLDKASEHNERLGTRIRTADGDEIGCVQIAGLVARRILGTLKEGEAVEAGARMGLIRFGSRVDVYLPVGTTPLVVAGQRAVAGETILADGRRNAPPRYGRVS
jgi:phosphatidylserine decarboxylase